MRACVVLRTLFMALVAATGVGCGSGEPAPKLVSVSGTITLDGKPLDGATLAFIPSKSRQVQPSWAYTDAAGKYALKTPEGNSGVQEGEYRIVISKLVMHDGSPIPPGSQTAAVDGRELVPHPHSDPRETKNVAIVTKEGDIFDVAITTLPAKGTSTTKSR